ncbi:MAG: hypothetical protein ABH884_00505 [Candidatus Komeilibacteria bacterium]
MKLADKIYPSITVCPQYSWRYKLGEINSLGLKEVSLFPTFPNFDKIAVRKDFYKAIEQSCIKHIPHVHIRDDFKQWELDFFYHNYGTRVFNIHEYFFNDLHKWPKYKRNLYVEYNYDSSISKKDKVKQIGGLCIDLSHFWSGKHRDAEEYRRAVAEVKKYKVGCNHLNGYSYRYKHDLHYVRHKHQLDYLKEIPRKYFSNIISLEMNNSIRQQIEYKKYIIRLLNS